MNLDVAYSHRIERITRTASRIEGQMGLDKTLRVQPQLL